jgi:phage recombination protein Bet
MSTAKETTGPQKSKALTKTTPSNGELIHFDEEKVALIKSQIAPKATNDELQLFLYQCKRTGLDPLTRQIYCIHRSAKLPGGGYGDKMTIQTAIDGFRVVAERSGVYAGQGAPRFFYNDKKELERAEIDIYKFNPHNGERYLAAVGVAFFKEYVQTSPMWVKMPHVMIAKVAEALGLRKAFPQDLSGLYTDDEIPTEENTSLSLTVTNTKASAPPAETKVNHKDEEASGHFTENTVDTTAEVSNAAPGTTGLTPEVWKYCEARQTIAKMLLSNSIFIKDTAADAYLNLYQYVYETNGKKMNKPTYEKIKIKLQEPANIANITPKALRTEISMALQKKGLTNPDTAPKA